MRYESLGIKARDREAVFLARLVFSCLSLSEDKSSQDYIALYFFHFVSLVVVLLLPFKLH